VLYKRQYSYVWHPRKLRFPDCNLLIKLKKKVYCHVFSDWTRSLDCKFLKLVTTSNYSAIANSHNLHFITAHTNFSDFTRQCLVTDPNNVVFRSSRYQLPTVSQLTHVSKCPHILDCLSWLANKSNYMVCYDRLSILLSSTHEEPKTRFLLLSDSCGFVDVVRLTESGEVVSLTLRLPAPYP
jgi:hypothetical protein